MHYFIVDSANGGKERWGAEADELFHLALHLSRIDGHAIIDLTGTPSERAARLDVLSSITKGWSRYSGNTVIAVGDAAAALDGLEHYQVCDPRTAASKVEYLSEFTQSFNNYSRDDGFIYPHAFLPKEEQRKRRRTGPYLKTITRARIEGFGLEHTFSALPRKDKTADNLIWRLRERLGEDEQILSVWTAMQGDSPKKDPSVHFFFGSLVDAALARLLVEG